MNTKKLYISNSPAITAYPTQAHLFATFPDKRFFWWFYENALNLYARTSIKNGYVDFFHPIPWKMDPWIAAEHISYSTLHKLSIPFSEICRKAIDSGKYIFSYLDRYYLKNAPEYKSVHFVHEMLIYGYDELGLYIADFYGKYTLSYELMDDIDRAFLVLDTNILDSLTGNLTHVVLFSYQILDWYDLDLDKVICQLEDYYHDTTSFDNRSNGIHLKFSIIPSDFVFGKKVYQFLIEYLNRIIKEEQKEGWDIRGLHCIYNQKVLIRELLDEIDSFYNIQTIMNDWNCIVELSRVIELKFLHASITLRFEEIDDVINRINNMFAAERPILQRIIVALKEAKNIKDTQKSDKPRIIKDETLPQFSGKMRII